MGNLVELNPAVFALLPLPPLCSSATYNTFVRLGLLRDPADAEGIIPRPPVCPLVAARWAGVSAQASAHKCTPVTALAIRARHHR